MADLKPILRPPGLDFSWIVPALLASVGPGRVEWCASSQPWSRAGDRVYVLQHCARLHFDTIVIASVYAARSGMACVSLASLLRFRDMPDWAKGWPMI